MSSSQSLRAYGRKDGVSAGTDQSSGDEVEAGAAGAGRAVGVGMAGVMVW